MKNLKFLSVFVLLAGLSLSVTAQIKLGACTSVKNAQKVKDAGGEYIEEGASRFLMPLKSDEEFAANLALAKASPLPIYACNGFFPGEIRLTGPDRDHDLALEYAETAFKRGQQVGVKRMVLGSAKSRNLPEGYDPAKGHQEFVALLKKMGPIAAKYDIIVVLEPLNRGESNFMNTVAEGVAIVKDVNHPNIQCLADIYHMLLENEGPQVLIDEIKHIYHCHVAEKEGRSVPGTHGEDLTPYYDALNQAGYTGGLSIEARWQDFGTQIVSGLENLREKTTKK